MSEWTGCDGCEHAEAEHTNLGLGLIDCQHPECLCHRKGEIDPAVRRWADPRRQGPPRGEATPL